MVEWNTESSKVITTDLGPQSLLAATIWGARHRQLIGEAADSIRSGGIRGGGVSTVGRSEVESMGCRL
jgi:hypothetical protein